MWGKLHAKLIQGTLQLPGIDSARAVLIKVSEHFLPVLIFFRSAIYFEITPTTTPRGWGRLKNTHLDVSPKPGELVQHPIKTQNYNWFLEIGTAYLVEADVSRLVLVLIRCKDICHALGKIHRGLQRDSSGALRYQRRKL
jgi:hypothetical protein